MQRLLPIIALFIFTQTYAQDIELKGKYTAFFLASETINFVGKDSFYFYGYYCEKNISGKGRCEILDNRLYLNFEKKKSSPTADSLHIDKIEKTKCSDSIAFLKIICLDKYGVPIPFATILMKKREKDVIGTTSDKNGIATLKIRNNFFPIEINILKLGLETKKIILTDPSNYSLTTFSSNLEINQQLENGEQYKYEIEELTEDQISMRPANSYDPYRKYKRSNKRNQ